MPAIAAVDEALLIKIEKLLRQAEDPGATPPEREAFHNHAMRMMERYRIDRSLIGGRLAEDDIIGDYRYGTITGGAYSRVRLRVISEVAEAFDCKIYWRHFGNGPKDIMIFGFKSDADLVVHLAHRLLDDADAQAAELKGERDAWFGPTTLGMRRGFYNGYAYEVGRRLRAATAEARAEAELEGVHVASTDLVLVDRRSQVHDAYAEKKVRTASPIAGGASAGYRRGKEAGGRANLATGGNQVTSGTKALGR